MKKQQPEYELQKAICQFLRVKYPNVLFKSDTGAGVKLTMPQAVRNKAIQKDGFKCPDLMIFEPKRNLNFFDFCGLFLELKAESPYNKNGTLKQDMHIQAQWQSILELRSRGYWADFIWSLDQAIEIFEDYLK